MSHITPVDLKSIALEQAEKAREAGEDVVLRIVGVWNENAALRDVVRENTALARENALLKADNQALLDHALAIPDPCDDGQCGGAACVNEASELRELGARLL